MTGEKLLLDDDELDQVLREEWSVPSAGSGTGAGPSGVPNVDEELLLYGSHDVLDFDDEFVYDAYGGSSGSSSSRGKRSVKASGGKRIVKGSRSKYEDDYEDDDDEDDDDDDEDFDDMIMEDMDLVELFDDNGNLLGEFSQAEFDRMH